MAVGTRDGGRILADQLTPFNLRGQNRPITLLLTPPPRFSEFLTALICIELLYTNLLLAIAILKCLCDTTVCENERRNHSSKILAHFIHKMGSKKLFRSIAGFIYGLHNQRWVQKRKKIQARPSMMWFL